MTLRVSNKDLWIMARRFLTLSIRSLHGWQYWRNRHFQSQGWTGYSKLVDKECSVVGVKCLLVTGICLGYVVVGKSV